MNTQKESEQNLIQKESVYNEIFLINYRGLSYTLVIILRLHINQVYLYKNDYHSEKFILS